MGAWRSHHGTWGQSLMHSDPNVSSGLGALRNTGHSYTTTWDVCPKYTEEGLASCLVWGAEVRGAFTETKVEPGEVVDGALEEEVRPRWVKMSEQKCRDRKENAGSAKGADVRWTEVRGQAVGEGSRRGGLGKAGWKEHDHLSEAFALSTVTFPAPRTAASTEGRLPTTRLNDRMEGQKEDIRI